MSRDATIFAKSAFRLSCSLVDRFPASSQRQCRAHKLLM